MPPIIAHHDSAALADTCLQDIDTANLHHVIEDLERLTGQLTALGDTESVTTVATQVAELHRFAQWLEDDLKPHLALMTEEG